MQVLRSNQYSAPDDYLTRLFFLNQHYLTRILVRINTVYLSFSIIDYIHNCPVLDRKTPIKKHLINAIFFVTYGMVEIICKYYQVLQRKTICKKRLHDWWGLAKTHLAITNTFSTISLLMIIWLVYFFKSALFYYNCRTIDDWILQAW